VDDQLPTPNWAAHWEDTELPVEQVIAYYSHVLASAETQYSATEREALAAKESLVKFQPFIEGEQILLITDHAALTWAKTYENVNRRLASWGLVFAAYPKLKIVYRAGTDSKDEFSANSEDVPADDSALAQQPHQESCTESNQNEALSSDL
jgi:hypothetical protein